MTKPYNNPSRRPTARTGLVAPAFNPPPTDIALSASTVVENAANLTVIGALTATDAGETSWTWAITSGGSKFDLSGSTGSTVNLRRITGVTIAAGFSESVTVRITDAGTNTYSETFIITVTAAAAALTMPIGLRNYGGSTVASGSVIQFGVPVAYTRGLDPASLSMTLTRDSDATSIPVQFDLTSTTRVGGKLCYGVATAKTPFPINATTTHACTLTITPGGSYSGGTDTVTVSQFNARDFKIEVVGDDITGTGTASFNTSGGAVYSRKVKSGAVETGWEGWSRVKVSGTAQGKWGIRWRIMGKADTALSDWRVEAVAFCSDKDTAFLTAPPYGRTATFVLKAGSTTLNNHSDFASVWVSAFTGFKMYAGGDPILPAYGGATLRPVHDRDYLVAEKATFPFRWASDAANGDWSATYTPGSIGSFPSSWVAGGDSPGRGPIGAAPYEMLRNLSDDTKYRKGINAGLCQLSVAMHYLDPTTGYLRPMFGSYTGLGTANPTRLAWTDTYNSSGTSIMTLEWGHYQDTGFIPAMLTGDLALLEGNRDGIAETNNRYEDSSGFAGSPNVTGRPTRSFPFLNQYVYGSTISRYDDWPHRGMLNFLYLADDARHDKAYGHARIAQTQSWATDLFVDFLPWGSWAAFDGVKDGTSTTNVWAMGLTQFSPENCVPANSVGWNADVPWSTDFRALVLWLASARHGETYPQAVVESFLCRNVMARTVATGACVAYGSTFNNPSTTAGGAIVQDTTTYWQRYFNGTTTPGTRTVCPTTTATDESSKIEHKFMGVLALLHERGWAGSGGHTYSEAWHAVDACFGGGSTTWDETVGGRWVMQRLP